jgi:L-asparaginase II
MGILNFFSKEAIKDNIGNDSNDFINPILVNDYRGDAVENFHRGAISVVKSNGQEIFSIGNTKRLIFPSSTIKPIQVLPMFDAKIDKRFSLTNKEIAVAGCSHSGEMPHVNTIEKWLNRAGFETQDLSLGAIVPMSREALLGLFKMDEVYTKLHHPCSGLHTAILSICSAMRVTNIGYIKKDHPVQKMIAKIIEDFVGIEHEKLVSAIDGCSMPTYAMSIYEAAKVVAKFSDFEKLKGDRKEFAQKIISACIDQPDMIAGTGRFDTQYTKYARSSFAKSGKEGMQAIYLPEQKLGVFVKIDDGNYKAAHICAMSVIKKLKIMGDTSYSALEVWEKPVIKNSRGEIVGQSMASDELEKLISKIKI